MRLVTRRDKGPGGQLDLQETSKGVEGNWDRQTDDNGVGHEENEGRMDGATSSASKRLKTRPLAKNEIGQHEWRKRMPADVPEPSNPGEDYCENQ
jgi:hypothetical protein